MESIRDQANRIIGAHEREVQTLELDLAQLSELVSIVETLDEARRLAKACSTRSLEIVHYLEKLNSDSLSALLDDNYLFRFNPVMENDVLKGLTPEVKVGDGEFDSPLEAFGSSVCQLLSLLNHAMILKLSPVTIPVLILDEPFSNISYQLAKKAEEIIEALCEDGGLQLIICTHHLIPRKARTYIVYKHNGISHVELQKGEQEYEEHSN